VQRFIEASLAPSEVGPSLAQQSGQVPHDRQKQQGTLYPGSTGQETASMPQALQDEALAGALRAREGTTTQTRMRMYWDADNMSYTKATNEAVLARFLHPKVC
jgi:hypothetical protein